MYFGNYRLRKPWLDKLLKSTVSADILTTGIVIGPKDCWNLKATTFIIFIDHSEGNSDGKRLS